MHRVEELKDLSDRVFSIDEESIEAINRLTAETEAQEASDKAQEEEALRQEGAALSRGESVHGEGDHEVDYPFVYGRELLMGQFDAQFGQGAKVSNTAEATKGWEQVRVCVFNTDPNNICNDPNNPK